MLSVLLEVISTKVERSGRTPVEFCSSRTEPTNPLDMLRPLLGVSRHRSEVTVCPPVNRGYWVYKTVSRDRRQGSLQVVPNVLLTNKIGLLVLVENDPNMLG